LARTTSEAVAEASGLEAVLDDVGDGELALGTLARRLTHDGSGDEVEVSW
jgi:hypothetical protein